MPRAQPVKKEFIRAQPLPLPQPQWVLGRYDARWYLLEQNLINKTESGWFELRRTARCFLTQGGLGDSLASLVRVAAHPARLRLVVQSQWQVWAGSTREMVYGIWISFFKNNFFYS